MSNLLPNQTAYFLAAFIAGSIFAALILAWAIGQTTTSLNERDTTAIRKALRFALRQLAFFVFLGIGSATLMMFAFFSLATKNPRLANSAGSTPPSEEASQLFISRLTGIRLPLALSVVKENDIVNSSSQQLQKLVRQVDSRSRLGQTEVLMWRENYQRPQAAEFILQVQKELKNSGYLYQETSGASEKNSSIREFVAVSRAQKKVVPGFWMVTNEFLLLSWGGLVPAKTTAPR